MLDSLKGLPLASAAFRAGRLSIAQAMEIVDAASGWPDAEEQFVAAAQKLSRSELEECRRVKAAAVTDESERHRRVRTSRFCGT